MRGARSPAGEYGRFLIWTVAAGAAAALLGAAPTRRIWGGGALPAMLAGCAIGVIASAVGGLPILISRRSGSAPSPVQGLLSTAVRLAVLVVLGLSLGLSGWFEVRPLVVWTAIGYGALLALDVWYAVRGF